VCSISHLCTKPSLDIPGFRFKSAIILIILVFLLINILIPPSGGSSVQEQYS
jgi:hypothetical protein